jgi:hypothetical protein
LGDQIKKNEMGGECGTYGGKRGACRVLVGRTDGETPFARPMLGGRIILNWIFKK